MKRLLQQKRFLYGLILLLLAATYAFFDSIHFGCIYQRLFHMPCPGCGMTRALKSALVLDWKAAFYYHPMVFFLPLIMGYIVTNGHLFKHKPLNNAILFLIGAGFLINYIIKLAQLAG